MEEGAGMPQRRSASLRPQIQPPEENAGATSRLQPPNSLHSTPLCCPRAPSSPQIQPMEEAAGMPPSRSAPLHPQIRNPCLRPQIQANEDGAGVTCRLSSGTSPVELQPLPLNDDMLREILVRLPPRPSSLPRVSAVCKRWLGLVTDPKFIRRFSAHHRGKPPLLGVFESSYKGIVFTPVLDPPDSIPPQRFDLGRYSGSSMLDCRHGRVLVVQGQMLLVCDPITGAGEQRCVAVPSEFKRGYLEGAVVLCAAGDHQHVSSYKAVLLSTSRGDYQCLACVYSLETGEWGHLVSTEAPYEPFYADDLPATLVGNSLYWSMGDRILEFDLDTQNLVVIMAPPDTNDIYGNRQIIQGVDGAVGYTILSYPRLQMWQRNTNDHGVVTWVLWKTIEMHTILWLSSPDEGMWVHLLGHDEDDVVFLCYEGSVYMVQLKWMRSRKLSEIYSTGNRYFPFKSFFAPGIAGGFNGAKMLNIG